MILHRSRLLNPRGYQKLTRCNCRMDSKSQEGNHNLTIWRESRKTISFLLDKCLPPAVKRKKKKIFCYVYTIKKIALQGSGKKASNKSEMGTYNQKTYTFFSVTKSFLGSLHETMMKEYSWLEILLESMFTFVCFCFMPFYVQRHCFPER